MLRRLLVAITAAIALLAAYLLLWPVPVDPEAWEPPHHAPASWKPTGGLAEAKRVELTDGHGPEDLDVDSEGRIYGGLHDGRIMRWNKERTKAEVFASTGGRPLGLHWDPAGRLLVADANVGLLRIDADGKIETLATECGGKKLVFTDDLDVAHDGTIWFSDASVRFGQPRWKHDILENRASGRLCAWRPTTGEAEEVIPKLYFANGVAIDPAQGFVLVNETSRYRVRKYWLAGPKKGHHEIIIDNLPGFPDGISTGSDGVFWIALASPRSPALDGAAMKPWMRKLMVRLPDALRPQPQRTARAMGIDENGKVVHDLFDPKGTKIYVVTSVQERNGELFMGSLVDTAWASIAAP